MKLLRSVIAKIKRGYYRIIFGSFGPHSYIIKPLRIDGTRNIYIMERVSIHNSAWLAAYKLTGYVPRLEIGKGTTIGDYAHIIATRKVQLGENVLIANGVYISDNLHEYEDPEIPICNQGITQKKDVIIGDDSWIGEHVSIIGASIGKHCVIGANSVVIHDIPDYCVAVGAPAKVIKRYDFVQKRWIRV